MTILLLWLVLAMTAHSQSWDECFTCCELSDSVIAVMRRGGSLPADATVSPTDLRYLRIPYYNYSGEIVLGELVCHKSIALDVLDIFRELFRHKYAICQMVLIDNYGADDELSMSNNNTSSFCYRRVANAKSLSLHAQGRAIDINPLDNPCVTRNANGVITRVEPDTPAARANATDRHRRHAINNDDLCYKLFTAKGFTWGGAWKSKKDYQHFQR